MSIFVVAPDIFFGDAVGNHCLGVVRSARRLGWDARAFAERFSGEVEPISNFFEEVTLQDVLFVSYSIYDPFLEKLLAFPGRKICYFHGITDPELLRELDPITASFCARGIEQLPLLKGFDLLLANSQFTVESLAPYLDISRVKVLPPVSVDMPIFRRSPVARFKRQKFEFLVVGRVLPHKRIEDAIDLLSQLREKGCDAWLTSVGSFPDSNYSKYLIAHADRLGVSQYIRFTGWIDQETLYQHFENADALVSLSRHEGFCVPVLEAMHLGLPVFVRSGTAASEVGGEAVAIFESVEQACDEISKVYASEDLCLSMIESGRRRAAEILGRGSDAVLETIFQDVCSGRRLIENQIIEASDELPLITQDGEPNFFNIRPYMNESKLPKSLSDYLVSLSSHYKVFFEWGEGFYALEKSNHTHWRWSQENSVLSITNNENHSIRIKISFSLCTISPAPAEVRLSGSLVNKNFQVSNTGVLFSEMVTIPPGFHTISFCTDAPRAISGPDPRMLFFRLDDFIISQSKIFFEWVQGFYALEKEGGKTWRWAQESSSLSVTNNENYPIRIKVSFNLANSTVPAEIKLSGALVNESLQVDNSGILFSQMITIPPGIHSIFFSTTAPALVSAKDPRALFFRVEDFKSWMIL